MHVRVSLAVCALVVALAPVARAATSGSAAAPLDQYFGKMKMSAIGLRMDVDRLGRRYHARTISDQDLVHDAGLAQDAFYDWQRRYPNDPWIVPTAFHLEQLYQAVQSDQARAQATAMLHFIADKYPKTADAHIARVRLAQGFPALQQETAVHPTPDPYGSPAAAADASPMPSPAVSGASPGVPGAPNAPATALPATGN